MNQTALELFAPTEIKVPAGKKVKLVVDNLAANLHQKLVTIHPFIDGNGRTARLIMNLILLRHGFTIANLSGDLPERMRYYKALEKS